MNYPTAEDIAKIVEMVRVTDERKARLAAFRAGRAERQAARKGA